MPGLTVSANFGLLADLPLTDSVSLRGENHGDFYCEIDWRTFLLKVSTCAKFHISHRTKEFLFSRSSRTT